MTIREVVDKILAYHPPLKRDVTCDSFKCGNPDDECTGIVTTCCASVDVIRKAAELGCNLIVCHEPVFYAHMDDTDWEGRNPIYTAKLALANEHGIAIWRDHDHIHTHRPDGISYGVMKELEWDEYLVSTPERPRYFRLPETTVRELAAYIKSKLGMDTIRVIGNLDAKVSTVRFGGHIYPSAGDDTAPTRVFAADDTDVMIPGELIDWTTASCARDAGQLGFNKALIVTGHFNAEELGMKYAVNWISELVEGKLPVHFVRSADMYQYV